MTPDEFIRNLQARKEALNANRASDCLRITLDLIAQVRLRVQTRGEDYQERTLSPYTPGYAQQRARDGYQVGHVDFTREGRAWASVRPEVINQTNDSVTIEVAPRTGEDLDKFRGAVRKRGNLLLPSDSEIEIAARANRERVLKYFS